MIAIILGTKAELIKTMPLMKELSRRKMPYTFIHTGQHSLGELCDDFNIRKPDIVLYAPPKLSSRFMVKTHKAIFWGLTLIPKIRKVLNKLQPDFVFYHGDTLSTAAAALASSTLLGKKRWLNGHLEAGLRSNNLFEPFPEEISRRIADRCSDLLFAPSKLSAENVMHLKGRVYMTGNTVVDGIQECLKIAKQRKLPVIKGKYVAVNIHRHENIKSRARMTKIYNIIKEVGLPMIWPLHDNTKKQMAKFGLWDKFNQLNIKFSPLVTYVEFLWMLNNATYLITDGGSIQEESLALKKPCILLREKTERIEGLSTGLNFLTKLDLEYAEWMISRIEAGKVNAKKFVNPYGDGSASKQIADVLEKMK
ncbi:MAG: UDP-N-acetylglucosamine 2-epimerase (non-hydrolyzing) [Candidatus Nanoarchaeia archaeon]|nr:UDP-N-acetylglucosamine 2-epimerase (non-hydrolyzing) [Candidatus Nanoarchaeia archaeon]MDD5239264.1 UDP-N-acetylglucosamine 2-epimerase (non-hydrolyzing) [Candidatus Nanoarchaeia archaeon]